MNFAVYRCFLTLRFFFDLMGFELGSPISGHIYYTQSLLQGTVYKERIGRLVNFSKKSRNTLVFLTKNKEQFEIC